LEGDWRSLGENENAALERKLDPKRVAWFRERLRDWSAENFREFPWRQAADPYAILVAECLLQQTEASRVVPLYGQLLERYPKIGDLSGADLEALEALLHPLGLHFRAKRLRDMAGQVVRQHGGTVPDRESDLLALPGVGPYTARSVCANAFGQSLAILDTNVARILERFFGLEGGRIKSRDKKLWQAAQLVSPETDTSRWNLTLLDFGAIVCRARSPLCEGCPLQSRCLFFASRNSQTARG
jgi:A/G-specific adenine glycosylase